MNSSQNSLMLVDSLKPEYEFEVIKLVLLRESYLQRLSKYLTTSAGKIDIGVIGLVDILRNASVEVVEIITIWQRTQISYPVVKPFLWNGVNYLLKMTYDMQAFLNFPSLSRWLGFQIGNNPFILPPEIYYQEIPWTDTHNVIIFGDRPKYDPDKSSKKKSKVVHSSSPYNTPVVNDASLLPSSSIVKKFESNNKSRSNVVPHAAESSNNSLQESSYNPFRCFVSMETVKKAKKCWNILCELQPDLIVSSTPTTGHMKSYELVSSDHNKDFLAPESYPATKNENNNTFESEKSVKYSSDTDSSVVTNSPTKISQNTQLGLIAITDNVSLWAPQKVVLQRAVHKRGGELFSLTAAGTKGRTKAPWRRSRLERMGLDLERLREHEEVLQMTLEDVELSQQGISLKGREILSSGLSTGKDYSPRTQSDIQSRIQRVKELYNRVSIQKQFLNYQLEHFNKIIKGKVKDLTRMKAVLSLKEGQALQVDESLSIALENKMASTIQRQIRRKFGRVFRSNLLLKMHRMALHIQSVWRRHKAILKSKARIAMLQIAQNMQRIWRGRRARIIVIEMRLFAIRNAAAVYIQRIWRGIVGRRRGIRKKRFLDSIASANACVMTTGLTPAMIDDLAEELAEYMHDFHKNLPIELLSLIRAILYMFNADEKEYCKIENLGMFETEYFKAESLSWAGARKLIKRKGKFLRRLRGLAFRVKSPDARRLVFNDNCVRQMSVVVAGVHEKHFNSMMKGKACAVKLLEYVTHLKLVYDLQKEFPGHFDIVEPFWLRNILMIRSQFEMAKVKEKVAQEALVYLTQELLRYTEFGVKWKTVLIAKEKTELDVLAARDARLKVGQKLKYATDKQTELERKRLHLLEGIERAKYHSLTVVMREIQELIHCKIIDEKRMNSLKLIADERVMAHLEVKADLSNAKANVDRDRNQRDFEALLNFQIVYHKWCVELGCVEAALMILQNRWYEFLDEIGGLRYIADIQNDSLETFVDMKEEINELILKRHALYDQIKIEINNQIKNVAVSARQSRTDAVEYSFWDRATPVEEAAEKIEDEECARKSTVLSVPDHTDEIGRMVHTTKKAPPIMCIVDVHIPTKIKNALLKRLQPLNFVTISEHGENISSVGPQLEAMVNDGHHILFYADIGFHASGRAHFMAKFRSLYLSLSLKLRVVCIDGIKAYRLMGWHSTYSVQQSSVITYDSYNTPSTLCVACLGRIRYMADLFALLVSSEGDPPEMDFLSVSSSSSSSSTSSSASSLSFVSTKSSMSLFANHPSNPQPDTLLHMESNLDIPEWLKKKFQTDFSDFMEKISYCQHIQGSFSIKSETRNEILSLDVLIAATISCVFSLWRAPILPWTRTDAEKGCQAFLTLAKVSRRLTKYMFLHSFYDADILMNSRFQRVKDLKIYQEALQHVSFYHQPARYLLLQWCKNVFELNEHLAANAGSVKSGEKMKDFVTAVVGLNWNRDVCSEDVDNLVSQLLRECFYDCRLQDTEKRSMMKTSYLSGLLNSLEKKLVASSFSSKYVNIYQYDTEVYIGVDDIGIDTENKHYYFTRVDLSRFISMLKPTHTELTNGVGRMYHMNYDQSWWLNHLLSWTHIDDVNGGKILRFSRIRSLLLCQHGSIDGHICRIEVYEEVYGELVVMVYGLPHTPPIQLELGFPEFQKIQRNSDLFEEREALMTYDVPRVAGIFVDRLRVFPSKNYLNSLEAAELPSPFPLPKCRLKIRKVRGPGRITGSQVIRLLGRFFILTVFEISDDSDVTPIRVTLYDCEKKCNVEYRFSAMEKLLYFKSEKTPLIQQIIERLHVSYTNVVNNDDSKKTIPLGSNIHLIPSSISPSAPESSGSTYRIYNPDDDNDEGDEAGDKVETSEPSSSQINENTESVDGVSSLGVSDLGYVLSFRRSIYSRNIENITIHISLRQDAKSFIFQTYDNFTRKEVETSVTYESLCELFKDFNAKAMTDSLSNIEYPGGIVELVIKILNAVFVKKGRREGLFKTLQLQLKGDKKGVDPITIAYLREHILGEPEVIQVERPEMSKKAPSFAVLQRMKSRLNSVLSTMNPEIVAQATAENVSAGVVEKIVAGNRQLFLARQSILMTQNSRSGRNIGYRASQVLHPSGLSSETGSIQQIPHGGGSDAGLGDTPPRLSLKPNLLEQYNRTLQPSLPQSKPMLYNSGKTRTSQADIFAGQKNIFASQANIYASQSSLFSSQKNLYATTNFRSSQMIILDRQSSATSAKSVTQSGHSTTTSGQLHPRKDTLTKTASLEAAMAPSRKIEVSVMSATGLSKTSTFTTMNVVCFVNWNGVQVGLTKPVKNNSNPEWSEKIAIKTKEGQSLHDCALNFEVYEMQGAKKGIFLGGVTIAGQSLLSFFDLCAQHQGKEMTWLELEKSAKLTEKDNKHVKGRIAVRVHFKEEEKAAKQGGTGKKMNKIDKFFGTVSDNNRSEPAAEPVKIRRSILPSEDKSANPNLPPSHPLNRRKSSASQSANSSLRSHGFEGNEPVSPTRQIEEDLKSVDSMDSATQDDVVDFSWEMFVEMSPTNVIVLQDNLPYHMIRTPLQTVRKHWRYTFVNIPNTDEQVVRSDGIKTDEKGEITPAIHKENDNVVENDTFDSTYMDTANTLPLKKEPKIPYFNLEQAFINRRTSSNDDSRICWRGCVMPYKLISDRKDENELKKSHIFMKRSARLVKLSSLDDLTVLSEVHYYDTDGNTSADDTYSAESSSSPIATSLPVCVREIVSNGVGLVSRLYRIEVYTNTGLKIGGADIRGDEDLARVVGKLREDLLNSSQINLPAVFEYIVNKRMCLQFSSFDDEKSEAPSNEWMFWWRKSCLPSVFGATVMLDRDIDVKVKPKPKLQHERTRNEDLTREISTVDFNIHNLRILTKWHKMYGTTFLATVLLQGNHADLVRNPDKYFSNKDKNLASRIYCLQLKFKLQNLKNKVVVKLIVPGTVFQTCMKLDNLSPTFSSSIRRAKFGEFLLSRLRMEYDEYGQYILSFEEFINT